MSISDILSGINAELEATPDYFDFKVQDVVRDGRLLVVTINSASAFTEGKFTNVVLDESFEGAKAWWIGQSSGSFDVLTVVPEDERIVLRNTVGLTPSKGGLIRLYPPRYLDALHACWQDRDWAAAAWEAHETFTKTKVVEQNTLSGQSFRWMRSAQRRALKLIGHSPAFLWGPPGTGKTTTLGILVAEYMHANPRSRVILFSTTNHAVDQAIIAVDKALEISGREEMRKSIARIGSRFIASQYAGREHLLPVVDHTLIQKLAESESERPDSSDMLAYSIWSEKVEFLRKSLGEQTSNVLKVVRLAAMTTTRGIFTLNDLRILEKYDLVIFDEASQISLAHAIPLMPLGHSQIFAGDPRQLSPIVRSTAKQAQYWLGRSPFKLKPNDGDTVCLLDEQSRMAEPICNLISHIFYNGKLKVAKKEISDIKWQEERKVIFSDFGANQHVGVAKIDSDGQWSQTYRGPIRYESAERIVALVAHAISQGFDIKHNVIVLTPFRAQRALIKQRLAKSGIKGVKVSTVHRAQGSEVPIVIFDPADGANAFLQSDEARRLINVAISRAKAKIIFCLSKGDLGNYIFQQIDNVINQNDLGGDVRDVGEFLFEVGFPQCAVGQLVQLGKIKGTVVGTRNSGSELEITNAMSGEQQYFNIEVLKNNFRHKEISAEL